MYYLGSKIEDVFVSTVVKFGHPMLTKKMDNITSTVMWQKFNISKKSQRIVLRYLSNFFSSRLVVPEYCIDGLGQNHVPSQCNFLISDRKKIFFWTKPISNLLTISLESLYSQECSTILIIVLYQQLILLLVVIMVKVNFVLFSNLF